MKRQILCAFVAFTAISFSACSKDWIDDSPIIKFNDPYFLKALIEIDEIAEQDIDKNRDGQVSEKEAAQMTFVDACEDGIRNADEIRYFTAIERLWIYGNELSILDLSKNIKLLSVDCRRNNLTSLDISKCAMLNRLYCDHNELSNITLNNTKIDTLYCDYNQLTSLDLSKCPNLTNLSCYANQLTSLDLSKSPNLTSLSCGGNQLTSLDCSKCPNLTGVFCDRNQLTSLDLSKCHNLEHLSCTDNPNLKSIILSRYHKIPQVYIYYILIEYGDIITYAE